LIVVWRASDLSIDQSGGVGIDVIAVLAGTLSDRMHRSRVLCKGFDQGVSLLAQPTRLINDEVL
jgi:hypothetical protein